MFTHQAIETDVVVVGGGLSGVCAAVAAARGGARVVLIQDRSVLGGNASSEVRMHVVGADYHGLRPGARETGIIEELRLQDAALNAQRSYSAWDLVLYDLVVSEPKIRLLLNTACTEVKVQGEAETRIASLAAVRTSTEENFRIAGRFYIDCSGDGFLGRAAGAAHRRGREAREEFGEPSAQKEPDSCSLGSSILFVARKYDSPQPFVAPAWARKFTAKDLKDRPIPSYEYGYWWSEWGGHLDTIKDNDLIRHELLRIALGVWDFIKNSGLHPHSEQWALEWVGSIPGKRESCRFLGYHVLSEGNLLNGTCFEDRVAYGGWPIDLHPVRGIDAPEESPCMHKTLDKLYTIPLRALVSRNVTNLMFAGRNISATHVAFASTRVMGTCSVVGQAVGTAAAVACRRGIEAVCELHTGAPLREIQQDLLKADAFIPDLRNEDEDDLARSAALTASGSATSPRVLVSGITRQLDPSWGSWVREPNHLWESSSLPAWIRLDWKEAHEISEIHLTFDSGLQRMLMLTASNYYNEKVIRAPQPETVRDYELWVDAHCVVRQRGNFLRKRVHSFPSIRGRSVTLRVNGTNGAPTARLFEIRVY